ERCAEVTYRTRLCTSDAQCMLRHPGRYEGQKRFCNTTTSLCEVLAEKRSDGHHIEGSMCVTRNWSVPAMNKWTATHLTAGLLSVNATYFRRLDVLEGCRQEGAVFGQRLLTAHAGSTDLLIDAADPPPVLNDSAWGLAVRSDGSVARSGRMGTHCSPLVLREFSDFVGGQALLLSSCSILGLFLATRGPGRVIETSTIRSEHD
ncbi:unnamed protein product, partial [Prorocentrum cordatum]